MKTLESAFDKALQRYFDHFKKEYPIYFGVCLSTESIIKDIDRCIESNKQAEPPQYDADKDY